MTLTTEIGDFVVGQRIIAFDPSKFQLVLENGVTIDIHENETYINIIDGEKNKDE